MKTKNKLTYVILILSIGILVYPFIWMILTAFKPDTDLYVYPPLFFPRTWYLGNFSRVFELIPFGRYYLNSLFVTAIGVVSQVAISIFAAYPLARLRFPLKNAVFTFVLLTMLMPFVVTMIPTFLIVAKFGWINTYKGIIVPLLFSGFSIIFLRQFFLAIPKDLEDSAKLDGCGYLRILFHVIIPNTKEGISTITLFSFLTWWRQYLWPLIVINTTDIRTLPIGLKFLLSDGGKEYNILMAASVMAIIPVVVMYILLEKQFIKSVTFTGIKG